jgi:transposase InsO family protein
MSEQRELSGGDERWARFRFSIIGPLLAAPPAEGELKDELQRLASKMWQHPVTGEWTQFGQSTIERWYYTARKESADPVGVLARKVREDFGSFPSVCSELRAEIRAQYKEHPDWSYQLHADNLAVWVKEHPEFSPLPSVGTIRRYMKQTGMRKRRRRGRKNTAGVRAAEARFENLEVRSYQSEYVNALWHLDFHSGSLQVLEGSEWRTPRLLGVLDDHSRLCCHAQWYLSETTEVLVHGVCQAIEKRGLPRALMSDNGSAMTSGEFTQGLERLGVFHERTLPYSPYQNGKQESFWGQVEGRLMAMLSGCEDLSLAQLNEATQAWLEMEYNRKVHSELGHRPVDSFINDHDVGRSAPGSEALRLSFTAALSRTQRHSDGTVSIEGTRYEVPSRYRHLKRLRVRYASWDLSYVHLADERTGTILCRLYPQNKQKNADGRRRLKEPLPEAAPEAPPRQPGMAPLLRTLIAEYAATGLPPAYLPKDETPHEKDPNHE